MDPRAPRPPARISRLRWNPWRADLRQLGARRRGGAGLPDRPARHLAHRRRLVRSLARQRGSSGARRARCAARSRSPSAPQYGEGDGCSLRSAGHRAVVAAHFAHPLRYADKSSLPKSAGVGIARRPGRGRAGADGPRSVRRRGEQGRALGRSRGRCGAKDSAFFIQGPKAS